MITYWRFILRGFGELCGPCAWIMAYQGLRPSISVHESSKLVIACRRCERNVWTLASHVVPRVTA